MNEKNQEKTRIQQLQTKNHKPLKDYPTLLIYCIMIMINYK